MAKRLPRPEKPVRVRLEWDDTNMRALDVAAAESGLSVASFARLALEMLVKDSQVSLMAVKEAAARLTSEPEKPAQKKPRKK